MARRQHDDDAVRDVEPRTETFSLDEGNVTIELPGKLSVGSVTDLDGYLKLFIERAKRRAEQDAAQAKINEAA